MSNIIPQDFVSPESVTKRIGDYHWRISLIVVSGSGPLELAVFFTDEPWNSVAAFAESALEMKFHNIHVSTVNVFGNSERAPENIRESFKVALPPYPPENHYSFRLPLKFI